MTTKRIKASSSKSQQVRKKVAPKGKERIPSNKIDAIFENVMSSIKGNKGANPAKTKNGTNPKKREKPAKEPLEKLKRSRDYYEDDEDDEDYTEDDLKFFPVEPEEDDESDKSGAPAGKKRRVTFDSKVQEQNYESDESDVIDDITPTLRAKQAEREKQLKKKRRAVGFNEEEELIADNDTSAENAVYIDDEFMQNIRSEEDADDRMLAYLEKKLGLNKKKKKKEDEEAEKEKKKGDLQKFVQEKRDKKKQKKAEENAKKKKQGKAEEEEEEEEEAEPDYSNPEDLPEISSDYDPNEYDGLDDILDGLGDDSDEEDFKQKYTVASPKKQKAPAVKKTVMEELSDEDDDDAQEEQEEDKDGGDDDDDDVIEATFEDDDEPANGKGTPLVDDDDEEVYEMTFDLDEDEGKGTPLVDDDEEIEEEEEEPKPKAPEKKTAPAAAPAGKYVPPHMRKAAAASEPDKRYLELKKALRSLINKLSIENLPAMVKQTLQLYESNSKTYFHEILADSLISSVCDNVNLLSGFVLVYASYIVTLHNIGGMEIGANFLEKLIQRFDTYIQQKNNSQVSANLLLFISHLFNMRMIYGSLIYDIVNELCKELSEFSVELIFKLLKTCGFQLRNDDPAALKNIIDKVQSRVEEVKKENAAAAKAKATAPATFSKRLGFMIDMIYDLRNNKQKKAQSDDQEKYTQVNKIGKQLQKEFSKSGEYTLRISYKDFIEAAERGRWWLVGSAWVGKSATDTGASSSHDDDRDELKRALSTISKEKQAKLEKMAKEQRMTTELRKTIFIIIMSAEDDIDAFQMLAKLGLKKYDREIIRVLVHCCCQEKVYNPYYELLIQRVCATDKQYGRTCQLVFFEHLNILDEYPVRKLLNLSRLCATLLNKNFMSLAMFKVIDFNSLKSQELLFYRVMIMHILLDNEDAECTRIFLRIVPLDHCMDLKDSLGLFLFQFIHKPFRRDFIYDLLSIRDVTKKEDKAWLKEQEQVIKKRAKKMKKVLSLDASDVRNIDDR